MGVVYYAKYFVWMEAGRLNPLRGAGVGRKEWVRPEAEFPAVQAHADYRASAHFEILVQRRVASIGNSNVQSENEIYELSDVQLLCTGRTVQALMNKHGETVPFSQELKENLISS